MPSYKELLAKKNELNQRIEEARRQESDAALERVKSLVATFGFTAQQVFPLAGEKKKVAAKYYDPDTGNSWTGRGKQPAWLEGKDRELYRINSEPTVTYSAPTDENNPFPIQ